MSSFTEVTYNHINTSLKQKVVPLLKQLEGEITIYLPDFFEKLFIQDCMHKWYVDFRADMRFTSQQSFKKLDISEISAYYAEFPMYYIGTPIRPAIIEQKLSDGSHETTIFSLLNKFDIIIRLTEICCPKHKSLRSLCGCYKQDDRSYTDLHQSLLSEITYGSTVQVQEKGGMTPTAEETGPKLNQEEKTSIINTMSKQLGLSKTQAKSLVGQITKQHPEYGFHEVVDACIRGIR